MDILKVLKEEKSCKRTRILPRACFDWNSFKRHFIFLKEKGFIEEKTSSGKEYFLTDKGKKLLQKIREVDRLLKE